jgi:broad specificity phosphatase PhoE
MIVLVRHGETLGESSIRLNGATDVALDARGVRQMERVRDALAGEGFTAIVASPLRRSHEAARIVRPGLPPQIVDDLREVHFGRWETLTWDEVAARDAEALAAMRASPVDFCYPGGESRAAFRARVAAAAQALVPGTLAVLHKGVIKQIIAALTGMPAEEAAQLPCALGSISRLAYDGRWRLETVSDCAHLGPDRVAGT